MLNACVHCVSQKAQDERSPIVVSNEHFIRSHTRELSLSPINVYRELYLFPLARLEWARVHGRRLFAFLQYLTEVGTHSRVDTRTPPRGGAFRIFDSIRKLPIVLLVERKIVVEKKKRKRKKQQGRMWKLQMENFVCHVGTSSRDEH